MKKSPSRVNKICVECCWIRYVHWTDRDKLTHPYKCRRTGEIRRGSERLDCFQKEK